MEEESGLSAAREIKKRDKGEKFKSLLHLQLQWTQRGRDMGRQMARIRARADTQLNCRVRMGKSSKARKS